ncbi:MAG: c-type cytochrome [Magnetococcales bacterium]|nr:c-type cytochrome [Magnetococcales bacterium]
MSNAAKLAMAAIFVFLLAVGFWRILSPDLETGKRLAANNCGTCHDLTAQKHHEKGPYMWEVFQRPAGSLTFPYSEAFLQRVKEQPFVWDEAHLDAYILNPESVIPHTRMVEKKSKHPVSFQEISDKSHRRDLIAYLKTLR